VSINRVVAILTPLVFAPLAGTCAAWLAEHFPGVDVPPAQLQEVFIAGALIALAPALQWMHGWQKHEARQAGQDAAARAERPIAEDTAYAGDAADLDLDPDFDLDLDLDLELDGDPVIDLDVDLEFDRPHDDNGARPVVSGGV
jgi:hypothetical protein